MPWGSPHVPPSGHGVGLSPSWQQQAWGAPPLLGRPAPMRRLIGVLYEELVSCPGPQPTPKLALLGSLTRGATLRPRGARRRVSQWFPGRGTVRARWTDVEKEKQRDRQRLRDREEQRRTGRERGAEGEVTLFHGRGLQLHRVGGAPLCPRSTDLNANLILSEHPHGNTDRQVLWPGQVDPRG